MLTAYGSLPLIEFNGDASYKKAICYFGDAILNENPVSERIIKGKGKEGNREPNMEKGGTRKGKERRKEENLVITF